MAGRSTPRSTVRLSRPCDWKLWYQHTLGEAANNKVLDFIDLNKPDLFTELEAPKEPQDPQEATIQTMLEYDMDFTQWIIEDAQYEMLHDGISRIRSLIWRTVDANELVRVPNEVLDVKEIIRSLKDRLCPTISEYQSDVRTRYQTLCRAPKRRGIEKWLNEWSLIEDDIKHANITGQFNLKIDFLNANLAINSGYAQAWALDVRRNKDTISFTNLVNDFKGRYREMGILKRR
ncbi:hypothetical protein EMCG_01780 [[Emmonsia] crescens]|uniref:Uncharacterized protein n=1 Tax=[Emmonsia] crescens TaxID=73230 RepID=A0A0G2I024_9EURO|nr:hypothetical protein EMCG_01780 [Emmonsia crescens UAMH 3008]